MANRVWVLMAAAVLPLALGHAMSAGEDRAASLDPARLVRVGAVDARFQSYNVEMVEVTGGRFWKPYASIGTAPAPPAAAAGSGTPSGMSPDLYEYRAPIDLANARLRTLAAALGPAYVRVSGTWANTTYLPAEGESDAAPPTGFKGVLTRAQWKGVLAFAAAVDAKIVTSFATGAGTRDASGTWTAAQARRLLDVTRASGGVITAAEFMNEPNLATIGGAPAGYDAAAYGRDFAAFRAFVTQAAPELVVLGPGSVAETMGAAGAAPRIPMLPTRELLRATGGGVAAFSYHHYGTVSKRCAGMGMPTVTPDESLSEGWLSRTDATLAFYRALRDEFVPGAPIWLTETADAACGGNPWGSWFLDTFRYLDQAGRLAKQGVQVVAHNTLAASDYGLIDERTLAPRPNYWGAFLWRRLMGTTVLDAGASPSPSLHLYAHCLRDTPGGVALLAINTDRTASATLRITASSQRYTLAGPLAGSAVQLNGHALAMTDAGALPALEPVRAAAGAVALAPATITFLAVPGAGAAACR